MILMVCVDDRLGMRFHGRRLSRDRAVCEDILQTCAGRRLHMAEMSAKLFSKWAPGNLCLEKAGCVMAEIPEGEFCFAEDPDQIDWERAKTVILYRWNRCYPADQYLPDRMKEWRLCKIREFPGFSHERITREEYERRLL